LLELHVSSDIGVNKNLREFSRSDDELRDQINSIITVATKLRRRWLVRSKFAVQLARCEKLCIGAVGYVPGSD